jgi:hypothetical protein
MSLSKHRTLRVRVLVKAFPQQSKAHEETVCCAGVTEDGRELLRLFPIRFRRLSREHQFDRFDLVEMTVTKASDPRPESFRVDEGSIRLIEHGNKLSDATKVRLWQTFIAPFLTQLYADNRKTNRSLGIIRPDSGSLKFLVKPAKDAEAEDRQIADQVLRVQQSSLLEAPLTPLEKPEYAALEHLTQIYGKTIPAGNLHFIMGTMAAHPRTFIIIGLLRSTLDPAELSRQGTLEF